MPKRCYLDHAATTPVDQGVLKAMSPYFREKFGNPSSLHFEGQQANSAVETARGSLSDFLGCLKEEIIFTSGATESNNLAIRGLALKQQKGHLVVSSIEHPAVLEVAEALEKEGFRLTKLPVSEEGRVRLEDLKRAVRNDTFLVSLMYVNNEIGTIQPVSAFGSYLSEINKERVRKNQPRIYFHTDAVQAVSLLPCQVDKLPVDLLSLSGHKIYGPKGVGALFVRKGTPIKPVYFGGHHERGLRPGTINAPLIAGLGQAVRVVSHRQKTDYKKISRLSNRIIGSVLKNIPEAKLNGSLEYRSPAIINFTFKNTEGESILLLLDKEGFSVSTGSACASGSLAPSYVLKALGLSDEQCHGSIRISLGRQNTSEEVDAIITILPKIIKKIRSRSPFK